MPRFCISPGIVLLTLLLTLLLPGRMVQAAPDHRLPVVASFSILGDMIRTVGGDDIRLTVLVGPDSDCHLYQPSSTDIRAVRAAALLVVNGAGLEHWLPRLQQAAGGAVQLLTLSDGLPLRHSPDTPGQPDPHLWQDPAFGQIYLQKIADALSAADPVHAAAYGARAAAARQQLAMLDDGLRRRFAALSPGQRRLITSHDAFHYLAAAYQLEIFPAQGISTDAEPTPRRVAGLIRQIRDSGITAVFLENMSTPALIRRIASEGGATIGGTLYADALTGPAGAAPTYLALLQQNGETLLATLQQQQQSPAAGGRSGSGR